MKTYHRRAIDALGIVLRVLAWGYLGGLWTLLLLRLVFRDTWWWLGFLNSFSVYWFLPLVLLLPLAGLGRQRGLLLTGALSLAIFGALHGAVWLPRLRPPAHSGPTLTVMTYNILGTNQRWPAIRETILDSQADVVALQELNPEVAAQIADELGARYPHQILDAQDSVISRYPVTPTAQTLPGNWNTAPRIYRLDLDGRPILLVNAHFYASFLNFDVPSMTWVFREREHQAQIVAEFVAQTDVPVLVTADFNATDQSHAYRLITATLQDAWREGGWGLGHTFPKGSPTSEIGLPVVGGRVVPSWLVRIDYIFHSAEWKTMEARLGHWDGVSDHRPVIATLALPAR
jgi:endonuclease/exonuclease/phosphatase (EEP) superfamily protein YafD